MLSTKEQEDSKYGTERKREVIDLCLNELISKGLTKISVREPSADLKLKKAGIYYYFVDKYEAIIECAEEAAKRLEVNLIVSALKDIQSPELMMARLMDRADEMVPTMKFFAQVCADPRYQELIKPTLNRLSPKYEIYAKKFAEAMDKPVTDIIAYFSMCVTAICDYMLFGAECFVK